MMVVIHRMVNPERDSVSCQHKALCVALIFTSSVCLVHKGLKRFCSHIAESFSGIKRPRHVLHFQLSSNEDALFYLETCSLYCLCSETSARVAFLSIPCSAPPEPPWVWGVQQHEQQELLQKCSHCDWLPARTRACQSWAWPRLSTGRGRSPGRPSPGGWGGTSSSAEKLSLGWSLALGRYRRRTPGNICETEHKQNQQDGEDIFRSQEYERNYFN